MRAIANTGDGKIRAVYELKGNKIYGQLYRLGTGSKLSDGGFIIKFSWTHGEITPKNFEDVVREDVDKRGWKMIQVYESALRSRERLRAGIKSIVKQELRSTRHRSRTRRPFRHLEAVTMDEDEYLAKAGPMPYASFHRSARGMSDAALRRAKAQHAKDLEQWQKERDRLRAEYREKVKRGEIVPRGRIGRLIQRATTGHLDNPSTQAAIRVLKKHDLWDPSMAREAGASGSFSFTKDTHNLILASDPEEDEVPARRFLTEAELKLWANSAAGQAARKKYIIEASPRDLIRSVAGQVQVLERTLSGKAGPPYVPEPAGKAKVLRMVRQISETVNRAGYDIDDSVTQAWFLAANAITLEMEKPTAMMTNVIRDRLQRVKQEIKYKHGV